MNDGRGSYPVLTLLFFLLAVQPLSASMQAAGPTLREALKGVVGVNLDDNVFDSPLPPPRVGRRFVLVRQHLNPSAERTFVFSTAGKFIRVLDGWELETLSNDTVIYEHSQVHFAPTHSVVISAFDPVSMRDHQIYPPAATSEVRRDFIARVRKVYADRGENWFREHNHHMDAEQFDTGLMGEPVVDERQDNLSFIVRFGDPDNARDPLPFTQRVEVLCRPLKIGDISCRESAVR